MKYSFIFIMMLVALTTLSYGQSGNASQQNQEVISDEEINARVASIKHYVLSMYKSGPNRTQDSATAAIIQRDHQRYLFELRKNHGLCIGGPVDDGNGVYRGVGIYNSTDKEAVRKLLLQDPAVKAGRLIVEVYDWYGMPGEFLK